jgi:hypothetical protein
VTLAAMTILASGAAVLIGAAVGVVIAVGRAESEPAT